MLRRSLQIVSVGCLAWWAGCVSPRLDLDIDSQRKLIESQRKELEGQRYALMAVKAQFEQNYEEAAANYTRIIDSNLGSEAFVASAYVGRGGVLARLRRRDQAIADLELGIRMSPADVSNMVERARSFLYLKEYSRAFSDFDLAVDMDRRTALRARASAYLKVRKFESAIKDFDEAFKMAQGKEIPRVDYLERGAAYGATGKHKMALDDFDTAIKLSPNPIAPYKWKGDYFLYRGDINAALMEYETAIRKYPNYDEAFLYRGVARFQQGQIGLASDDFLRAHELRPSSLLSVVWLSLARSRSGVSGKPVVAENIIWAPEEDWLRVLIDYYGGHSNSDAVIYAARDTYPEVDLDQRGKASFHMGQYALINGRSSEAIQRFIVALENATANSIEHSTARIELKNLGR